MNPLYQQMGSDNIVARFQKFRQSFSGDPQKKVQELLNSGKVSQEQYNRAVQQAQTLRKMLGM